MFFSLEDPVAPFTSGIHFTAQFRGKKFCHVFLTMLEIHSFASRLVTGEIGVGSSPSPSLTLGDGWVLDHWMFAIGKRDAIH